MLFVINWITPLENIPEIRDKFCKVFQEMFSNRDFTGIGKKVGKSSLETANLNFILVIHYLCLKQLIKITPSLLPPPSVSKGDRPDINHNNRFYLLSTFMCQALC